MCMPSIRRRGGVTPRWSVVNPALNLFLVGVLDTDDRLGREELLARGEEARPPLP